MAYIRCSSAADNDVTIELIGTINSATSGNNTMTLTNSISNYKYIVPTPRGATLDSDLNLISGSTDLNLYSTEYFKNNNMTAESLSGASGSIVKRSYTFTYVDDTTVTINAPIAGESVQLYGLK